MIKLLKAKDSSGFDSISNKLLKTAGPFLSEGLTFVINKCLTEGKFPSVLKQSKILPLFKNGIETSTNNYRPIAQLSSLSKVIEKIIFEQCNKFLIENKVIHDWQFGFRQGHGTNHAVLLTISELEAARNKNLYSIIVNLDLKKAFDTCDVSSVLPGKLQHYFQNEKTCKIINSFFQNRKQYVQIENSKSSTTNNFDVSVCQGSCLGPPMFSIYINDLPLITKLKTVLFADDTNCILSGKNIKELEGVVNLELSKISDFMRANKLSLNTSKTTFTIISPRNKSVKEKIKIKIGNDEIKEADEFRFLGIIIDKNLKFKTQFQRVYDKVKQGVNALICSKKLLNYHSKLQIYHSLCHSHLMYCCLGWMPKISNSELQSLATLQKRALRAIFCSKYNAHTNVLFYLSRITKVEDLIENESLKLMYQFKNLLLPPAIMQLISNFTASSKATTRNQKCVNSFSINGLRKNDSIYEIVKNWNECKLIEIKERSYELPSVKSRIKKYQRDRYNFSCERSRCHSCFYTNQVGYEAYMKV